MILWEFVNCASNRVLAWIFGYSELDYDPIELFFLAFYMLSIEETDLKLLFLRTLLDWFFVWRNQHFSTILDLLDFCNIRFWFVHPCILPVYLGVSLFWHQWILITYQKKIIASQRDNNALKDKNEKPNLLIQNLGLEINHYRIHPQWQEHS